MRQHLLELEGVVGGWAGDTTIYPDSSTPSRCIFRCSNFHPECHQVYWSRNCTIGWQRHSFLLCTSWILHSRNSSQPGMPHKSLLCLLMRIYPLGSWCTCQHRSLTRTCQRNSRGRSLLAGWLAGRLGSIRNSRPCDRCDSRSTSHRCNNDQHIAPSSWDMAWLEEVE